jgi:hypothetical protein
MADTIDFTDERVIPDLPKGLYSFVASVTTGPIVLLVSDDGGANFVAVTAGSFAADAEGTIRVAQGFVYKATMGASDTLRLSLSESGKA